MLNSLTDLVKTQSQRGEPDCLGLSVCVHTVPDGRLPLHIFKLVRNLEVKPSVGDPNCLGACVCGVVCVLCVYTRCH